MADGQLFKPEKDYTKEVDKQIPEAEELAKDNVQAALEKLSALEKHTRQVQAYQILSTFLADRVRKQASDLASTSRLLVAIITISKDSGDWGLINEQVLLLSKKHGQLKQATTKMVQVAMSFIDEAPDTDRKLALIETLRTVTEGKVWHDLVT